MEKIFPEKAWVLSLCTKLNNDSTYARIARKWEGDLMFVIDPDEGLNSPVIIYLDLWHGSCREAKVLETPDEHPAAYILQAPYMNFVRVLTGEWQTMQALLTRKLHVKGNMAYLVRNVPTVLEFVRCAQEVTSTYIGADGRPQHAASPES
jgi:putative sterol carrier protein